LNELIEYSFKVDGRQKDLILAVLKVLDSSVVLPSKIFNLKKKVSKFLSKPLNKKTDVVDVLYCSSSAGATSSNHDIVGDYCQSYEFPITSVMLENISYNSNEVVTSSYQLNVGSVLEIFRYKKKNNHSLSTFKTWLFLFKTLYFSCFF